MGYEKKSIKDILDYINRGEIYLPAIQRKYVWTDDQITRLLDSIMLGYPIGTFLFWKVKKAIINDKEYSMYEFIKDYHDRDMNNNPPAPQPFPNPGDETMWAVLDGQQRLTSLYIALQGSMSRKLPRKRWNNDDAFPKKELYFDLSSEKIDDEDITYTFKFLTVEDVKKNKDNRIWYKVKDILKYSTEDLAEVILNSDFATNEVARKNLSRLHTRLVRDDIINYFEVVNDSIDSVLDIFVRVNSGGTVLSKTDLLFSTIVSHWDDARDKIDDLLSEINGIGKGFKFSNDFIMRTCLYLLDMSVTLKVETFKKDSVLKIKDNWENISNSIKNTVKLLNEFGFNSENMISYGAVIPMVYYIYNGGDFKENSNKNELRKYIVIAQLKQIFGTASLDSLKKIRDALKKAPNDSFSMSYFNHVKFTGDRTLVYTSDEIDSMFDTYEMGSYTFMILSLLYPELNYDEIEFHQDHMHPHTNFEEENLNDLILPDNNVIDENTKEEWKRRRDTLANLQLLEGRKNEHKNSMPLTDWLDEYGKEKVKYLPENISYELSNFEEFMTKRQELMSKELKKLLL
ncbi:DUF262 domain-containing protein (plasmid) [Methanosphaera sp. ISO3-F5]|uniref:DUF262 domain-containing protein n=1 Tax=Methanosphaera sp. ISO3-F5 TaxID=1452353 RepID=UPI002B2601D5|nr:DUF262 domain-containing protein [Methanosphaera sp. ISO3-F5]WQH65464.1 DUF262 domain-containing protein [Methanosphaera sp. ISO3-F5]